MAIRVVSARRAFSMLARNLAEVISIDEGRFANYDFDSWTELSEYRDLFDDHTDWVQTVRLRIAVPKIIRVFGYDRLPMQKVKLNRRNIYARDNNICQYCGNKHSTHELSLDHVLPRSQGGQSNWDNLVCCCVHCNARKGGRTPAQAHMSLIRKPIRPKRNPVINLRLGLDKYACWQTFLDNAYWTVELK
ncbi:MAG: HNH endonuclease [Planctomycetaceae bacterium]|nr:HNH endonuclease [Planctomycetaceae bacterium]